MHINLRQCYASHRLKQVNCLALAVIVFCLQLLHVTLVLVFSMRLRRFWSRLKFGLRPVFFCTYEECNSHINLSGSPQGHPQFDILAAPCGMQVAHGHSIHAEAFTLLKFCRSTHPGIHSAAIMPSHSSIIIRRHCAQVFTRPQRGPLSGPQARADAPVCVRAPISSRSLVYTRLRARVPESSEHSAALFDHARGPGRSGPKDIVRDRDGAA